MIKRFWKKVSAICLAAVVSVSMIPISDVFANEETPVFNEENILTAELEEEEITSSVPLDNDALFEDYVEIKLEISSAPKTSSSRGSKLTGTNRNVYLKLKDEISKVADGESDSTVFKVSVDELGLEKDYWTAADLGVSAIVENGSITDDAVDALMEELNLDLNKVVTALLADCPYELYWYDKTSGVSMKGPGISASGNGKEWTIGFDGEIAFSFSVAQGYAAGEYTVDTTNAERVQNAVDNAQSIISDYRTVSDYEKLVGYKTEICDLVSYDHNAADDDSTPYGDPWQIISVFDGDTGTNVVCEGYAKSFQYLCDQTAFRRDITCILVTGTMSGGTGAGGHMWNIVNMENGNNYLVDVTNCDTGTVGMPDKLFLAGTTNGSVSSGYTFQCNYSSIRYLFDASTVSTFDEDELSIFEKNYEVSPEPDHIYGSPSYEWSETDSGYSCTATVVCEECDEDTEGHSITETVQATYALTKTATCDEAGEETYTAEFADDLFDTQEKVVAVPAIGHDWTFTDFTWTKKAGGGYDVTANYDCNNDASHKQSVAAVVEAKTEDATCTEAGSITYTATVSKADSPDQSEHTDSKTVTGEALGHDWGAPTYTWSTDYSSVTARRVCKNDSTHVETETVNTTSEVTKAATCDSEGVTTYTAVFENSAFAKQTKSVTDIPATGHSWNTAYTVDKEATDTEDGQESIHCSVCGEIKEGSERVIPKTDQPVVEKSGWIKENGYWYYYNEDGTMATSTWKKDSVGWCWLQADGRMLTNDWAKDSKGWCWIASSGYMPEETKWIQVNGVWYHITKGYRDQSKWMQDSKGWCYLGSDGKMVINDWAKDSKGWCWMGSDGYWVSNKWVKSGGQWYYIKSNHYMAADEWAKDSGGWMYMDANGKITRNKWIQSGGYWYYLKSNGYMATGTLTISGKTYKFDSSGRWVS